METIKAKISRYDIIFFNEELKKFTMSDDTKVMSAILTLIAGILVDIRIALENKEK